MSVLPSYRNQSIDLLSKLINWFLYEGNTGILWVNPFQSSLVSHMVRWQNSHLRCTLKDLWEEICKIFLKQRAEVSVLHFLHHNLSRKNVYRDSLLFLFFFFTFLSQNLSSLLLFLRNFYFKSIWYFSVRVTRNKSTTSINRITHLGMAYINNIPYKQSK